MCTTFFLNRCTSCNKTVESMVELEECPYCGFKAWWDEWQEIQIIEKNENKQADTVLYPNNLLIESLWKKYLSGSIDALNRSETCDLINHLHEFFIDTKNIQAVRGGKCQDGKIK